MKTSKLKNFPRSCLRGTAILLLTLFILATLLWLYQGLESGETELKLDRPQSFVLTNVNILTMDGQQVLPDYAIEVLDGVITELSPMTQVIDSELTVIDGKQAYVMPGLIDAHVHVLDRSYAKSALAAGVTTVRNMGGFPYHLKWRKELESGEWFGSRMVVSSPIFNSVEQGDPLAHFRVNDPERARQAVRDYIAEGYDFIALTDHFIGRYDYPITDTTDFRDVDFTVVTFDGFFVTTFNCFHHRFTSFVPQLDLSVVRIGERLNKNLVTDADTFTTI